MKAGVARPRGISSGLMIVAARGKIQPFVWNFLQKTRARLTNFVTTANLDARDENTLEKSRALLKLRRLVSDLFCIMFQGKPAGISCSREPNLIKRFLRFGDHNLKSRSESSFPHGPLAGRPGRPFRARRGRDLVGAALQVCPDYRCRNCARAIVDAG